MIYQIQAPSQWNEPASTWEWFLTGYSFVNWSLLLGLIVFIGYIVWIAYAALKARNAEPTISFVSLACAERMSSAQRDGTRHYLVQTSNGFPDLAQFREVLPAKAVACKLKYHNENHVYSFRAVMRADGRYDIFILKGPRYEDRSADAASTFRADVGTSRERIDFAAGMEPRDLPDAGRKAIFWAEANSRYILTGGRWKEHHATSAGTNQRIGQAAPAGFF